MGPRSRSFVVATLSPSHLEYKNTLNTFRHIVRTKEVNPEPCTLNPEPWTLNSGP